MTEAVLRDSVLRVRDLTVEVTTHRGSFNAVDGVSFDVPRGGAMGLVGESGSGKSLTLRAILGLLPPQAKITGGSVQLDGTELVGLDSGAFNSLRGPRIAMIFQEPMSALNPVMRVGEQIGEGPRTHSGLSKGAARAHALDLMRRVGIPDPDRRYNAYPHEFSGGMRQRVMIALALSSAPDVVLCDEPTTALDVTIQDQILTLLRELCEESGTSLVFVTHDLAVVAQTCQELAVLYAGRVVERGSVIDTFANPHHPYLLGLLRCAPDIDEVREQLVPIPGSPPNPLNLPPGCRFAPRCGFVQPDCLTGDIPLIPFGTDTTTRTAREVACLHHEECAASVRAGRVGAHV
jgi:oligopeptide/dipeptide ABC transporter ATP-binding protein